MQLSSSLLHAENGKRVVQVSAHEGERLLGSALGEASDAEAAEDRALARLQARLGVPTDAAVEPAPRQRPRPSPPSRAETSPPKGAAPPPQSLPVEEATSQEPPPDPEDWSSDLAQLDLQLRRLGWAREQEAIFLQRSFGHPSRSRLTTYADLTAYLKTLEGLPVDCDPGNAPVPLRRRELLEQSDQLLQQLGWDAEQGRGFLERHLAAASRQHLSDMELLQFNMLLEGELIELRNQK
jgi:hypothetical protein